MLWLKARLQPSVGQQAPQHAKCGRNQNSWTQPPILFHYIGKRKDLERMATAVFDAVAQGVLTVEPGKVFPLTAAAAAHAELESRQACGPLLLAP
jgi:NADPH2:quinone reductase